MKKLVLCITVASLVNVGFGAYSMEQLDKKALSEQLFDAVQENDINKAKELLEQSVVAKSINMPDKDGNTPLKSAVMKGNIEMVELLLDHGAAESINMPNKYGNTPLKSAVMKGNIEMVELLLDHGAAESINMPNKYGSTPLESAVWKDKIEMVQLLLDHGAAESINMPNKYGNTPLKSAVMKATLLAHTTPKEIEELALPFLMVLKRKRKESKAFPKIYKDLRNLLVEYIIIEDKLQKVKKFLPDYDENKLRALIKKSVIQALRRRRSKKDVKYPDITHDPDPFGTFYRG